MSDINYQSQRKNIKRLQKGYSWSITKLSEFLRATPMPSQTCVSLKNTTGKTSAIKCLFLSYSHGNSHLMDICLDFC